MNSTVFSNKEALRYGWDVMKKNLPVFLWLGLLSLVVSSMQNALGGSAHGLFLGFRPLLVLSLQCVMIAVHMGWIYIALRLRDGQPVAVRDILAPLPQFLEFLFGMILYGIIVAAGFVLLVVPGVIWAIRYGFTGMLIIDQKLDPILALRRSAELTSGIKGELFVFGLCLIGVNLLGALACGIGLLATLPVSIMAVVYVYRKLLVRSETRRPAPPLATEQLAPA